MNLSLYVTAEESNTMEIQGVISKLNLVTCAEQGDSVLLISTEQCSELTGQASDVHQGTRECPLDCDSLCNALLLILVAKLI